MIAGCMANEAGLPPLEEQINDLNRVKLRPGCSCLLLLTTPRPHSAKPNYKAFLVHTDKHLALPLPDGARLAETDAVRLAHSGLVQGNDASGKKACERVNGKGSK